ncbi:hypothetical protein EV122DRAFT_177551, partial [Schizophyllum commune]
LPDTIPISRDIPWNKAVLPNVPTRDLDGDVFSDDVIHEAMMANPIIRSLNITQRGRWVRPAESIGWRSSIVFAFEDLDGSALKSLLKAKIFMFGTPIHVKRWVE